jgi:hypothetical protein
MTKEQEEASFLPTSLDLCMHDDKRTNERTNERTGKYTTAFRQRLQKQAAAAAVAVVVFTQQPGHQS